MVLFLHGLLFFFIFVKNHQLVISDVIISTGYTIFANTYYFGRVSYHLCIFLLCSVSIFVGSKYTPTLEMAVWSLDLPSLQMAMFNTILRQLNYKMNQMT